MHIQFLCLGNISEDFAFDNIRETGFEGYLFDFSVDYETIDFDDILDIHEYLMKNNNIKKCLDLLKNVYWIFKHLRNGTF